MISELSKWLVLLHGLCAAPGAASFNHNIPNRLCGVKIPTSPSCWQIGGTDVVPAPGGQWRSSFYPSKYQIHRRGGVESTLRVGVLATRGGDEQGEAGPARPTPSVLAAASVAILAVGAVIASGEAGSAPLLPALRACLLPALSSVRSTVSSAGAGANARLTRVLGRLSRAGPRGLAAYAAFFTLWEMTVGITTPVETAAGMAFGRTRGMLASGVGKVLGASSSFLLGRYMFTGYVRRHFGDNEILSLVGESIRERPLRVALLMRFSPLPEFVKNFGLSTLPLKFGHFVAAVVLHGIPFTCLWTCMGDETANVMIRGGAPSALLKVLVSGVSWFGFFVSPTMIGIWIKSLRNKKRERRINASGGAIGDATEMNSGGGLTVL
mmetsp:Transcript_19825/g.30533  ORF Transcript_19825/g.30533 Transcript_19825/m.30533 type:complete len:381 (+) Transcript_19825:56-1198(+)